MSNEKTKDKLVGCEVRLDPTMSGMLIDNVNNFTFSFMDGGKSSMVVEESTHLDLIKRNIKHGILRVFKKDKDVTEKFGGPPKLDKNRPIVKEAIPRLDDADKLDASLAQVLNTNNLARLEAYIDSISDFTTLDRLYSLEKQGNNPCAVARDGILKKIKEKMKVCQPTNLGAYEDHSEDEELIMK
jgi:hypothetical protein